MEDWANLPKDLLVEISKRLAINADYVRFHAVCRPWRSALPEKPHRLPCQLPWLMLPNKDDGTPHCDFFNPSNNKVYSLELPEACGKYCWGASEGWLAFTEENPKISLLNPLTRAQIQLPPVTTFPHIVDFQISRVGWEYLIRDYDGFIESFSLKELAERYMTKIVLSKNPTVENYIAVAICGELGELGFCRSGDDKWTIIKDAGIHLGYIDIIYVKEQLYALNSEGIVEVWDIINPSSMTRTIISEEELRYRTAQKMYLVDLSGELLLVIKKTIKSVIRCKDVEFYQTSCFKVLKLNENQKWVKVKSLGDSMLFLGRNSSLSLSAKDFPGCKANCIYFTDDYFLGPRPYNARFRGGFEMGVFSLEDGSFNPFPCYMDEMFRSIIQRPIWVTPSLYSI